MDKLSNIVTMVSRNGDIDPRIQSLAYPPTCESDFVKQPNLLRLYWKENVSYLIVMTACRSFEVRCVSELLLRRKL